MANYPQRCLDTVLWFIRLGSFFWKTPQLVTGHSNLASRRALSFPLVTAAAAVAAGAGAGAGADDADDDDDDDADRRVSVPS